ncbi:MAG: redoxin domain-containing protein [Anaerolineales bacterium]|nr:redoxin domain-containing protein [Anaerolineales bacterium]
MKGFLVGFLFLLTACTMTQTTEPVMPTTSASLPDLGPAPELTNETWLNVDAPLRLADLRGKVVALEMWTFGCYNCQNVMPSLKSWHEQYADQGLIIIGNHYPEFSFEKDITNLQVAITENGIKYAVAQDNDGVTWKAYKNRYWPALYLIDKNGHIRYVHIGEGRYKETEAVIQTLLAE